MKKTLFFILCLMLSGLLSQAQYWHKYTDANISQYLETVAVANNGNILAVTGSGLYLSTNNGATFTKVVGTWASILGPVDITVAKDGTVFGIFADPSANGHHVYKSTDNGVNWTETNIAITTNEGARSITSKGANNIILGTDGGKIYYSSDGGSTSAFTDLTGGSIGSFGVNDFVVSTTTGTVLAIITQGGETINNVGIQHSVLRSSDNGATWAESTSGLVSCLNSTCYRVFSIAANTDGDFFAFMNDRNIYKSIDDGLNWSVVSTLPQTPSNRIICDSNNVLFAYGNSLDTTLAGYDIYRSTDNGLTWNPQHSGFTIFNGLHDCNIDNQGYTYISSTKGLFVNKDITSGIYESKQTAKCILYPNPAHSHFKIENEVLINQIEVYDMVGKKIEVFNNINAKFFSINTSKFRSGLYFVRSITEKGISINKVCVQ